MSARESTAGIELDRARFGSQRETWGHEITIEKGTMETMTKSSHKRLRDGHDWVGLDRESIIHDDDGVTSRVTLTHWKNHQIETDAERVRRLHEETHKLSSQWEETKEKVRKLEDEKGVVYDELCTRKYQNSDKLAQCIHMEKEIRLERDRKKKINAYCTGLAKEIAMEKTVTEDMRDQAEFLVAARRELIQQRDDIPCCTECCTACCWYENRWTDFFVKTVPLCFGDQNCKCRGERCCNKSRFLKTLDVQLVYNRLDKHMRRKRQAIYEALKAKEAFENAHKL